MKNNRKKVVTFRKKRHINVGTVIFAIIFIYLVFYIGLYIARDKISYYEVVYGTTSANANKTYEGIIIRDEKVVKASVAGYVSHHISDTSKTAVGETVCSIDESGKLATLLSESQTEGSTLEQDDLNEIKNSIATFAQGYSNTEFGEVYAFKSQIQSMIAEKININSINQLVKGEDKTLSKVFKTSKAPVSGIVTYYTDGYEGISYDKLKSSHFTQKDYNKVTYKTNDIAEKDQPIYKIIKSEDWGIVIPLDESDIEQYIETSVVNVRIDDSKEIYEFNIELFNIEGKTYAKLTSKKNMITFIDKRFVEIKIENNSLTGLKIPKTSIVQKDFYVIPVAYGTYGGNTKDVGFMLEVYDENNVAGVEYVNPDIYSQDEEYYYVSTSAFKEGDLLLLSDSEEKYRISTKKPVKGVYNINSGYCVFREIIIIDENTDYYIVESSTNYGLQVYDHIVLDSSLVKEEDIVYQ